jgi:two-component system LytT family response regulator
MSATMMRVVIVDDEELARHVIREHLGNEEDVEIAAECANGFEAVRLANELRPDLMFLDVQMPKLDGFEVLELIEPEIAVIFVTAFDQYAMRAFDAAAVDYLLKPFSAERFRSALERARQRLATKQPAPSASELKALARTPDQAAERVVVKDGARVHIIPIGKLDYVEAQDDYIELHSGQKSWLKQQSLASLEAVLDPNRFVRVHRSYLINIERVTKIEPYTKDTKLAILTDGAQIPMSRAGYARLKELMRIE